MVTKAEKDYKYYYEKYGEQHYRFSFEWKSKERGHIAYVPANDIKEAWPRLLLLLKVYHQDFAYKILTRAKERGVLSKVIKVTKEKLDSPTIWTPPKK